MRNGYRRLVRQRTPRLARLCQRIVGHGHVCIAQRSGAATCVVDRPVAGPKCLHWGLSTLNVAAVERINPLDVLERSRREDVEFDNRMKQYKAEQQKQEKEREARQKQDEAERQKQEKAEKALQEAHRKREAAEQRKREREAKAQEAQKKQDATAAKASPGASPSSATTTLPPTSTGMSEPSSASQP